MKVQYIFQGKYKRQIIQARLTDLNEFILSPPDSDIFVSDNEHNQFSCKKGEIEWLDVYTYQKLR